MRPALPLRASHLLLRGEAVAPALAMMDVEHTAFGTELEIHVVGEKRKARVIEMSPYDPDGSRMRV